jgi:outer membrane protein assembly factor BamB
MVFRYKFTFFVKFLLSGLFFLLGACSTSQQASITLPAAPGESHSSSASGEWAMEGYNLQRTRATTEDIQPPLDMGREVTVGGDTQFGSPVGIAQNLLFVEGDRKLYALALESGEEQWNFALPGHFISPAVAGHTVFVRAESGEEGYIVALTSDKGLKLWQFKFPRVGSRYNDVGGHVTSPVVSQGLVLVGAAQSFYALDAQSGKEVWNFKMPEPVASSATIAGDLVYFTDFDSLYALDVKTGEESWHFAHKDLASVFAPIIIDDQILMTSQNIAFMLNRDTGQVIWSKALEAEDLIPSAAAGERVYVKSTTALYALDRATGEVDWFYQGRDFISLPALTGTQLYIITRAGGKSQLRALSLADGQETWQIENVRFSNAAPVVAGGQVYVRTVDGSVLSYN